MALLARRQKILFAIIIATVSVAVIFVLLRFSPQRGTAIVYGVPYISFYNTAVLQHPVARAIGSVLQYWHQYDPTLPNPTIEEIQRDFPLFPKGTLPSWENHRKYFPSDVVAYFKSLGYDAQIVRTRDLRRVFQYFEPDQRTPLIIDQLIAPEYRGELAPYRVVIGISLDRKTILVHDQYFGPAYEISFQEWENSYPSTWPANLKYVFVVARPKNWKELVRNAPVEGAPYPDRASYEQFRAIMFNWLEALENISPTERLVRYEAIIADRAFLEVSPAVRSLTFALKAAVLNSLGQFAKARDVAEEGINLNKNLSRPYGVWGGYPIDEIALPWIVLGMANEGLGNAIPAINAYRRALAIEPENPLVQSALQRFGISR